MSIHSKNFINSKDGIVCGHCLYIQKWDSEKGAIYDETHASTCCTKKKHKPLILIDATSFQFPHCDPRILHAPGECIVCDQSGLQVIRDAWNINFTTAKQDTKKSPCPAIRDRGLEGCLAWTNNRPRKN